MEGSSEVQLHLKVKMLLSHVLLCDPLDGSPHQAPLSVESPRPAYWLGSWDLPDPGIKPRFRALQADSLPSEPPGKPCFLINPSLRPEEAEPGEAR